MTYPILLIRGAFSCAGSLAGACQAPARLPAQLNAPQPRPWLQAKTQQPIGVVGPVIIHVNGLAIWLGFVDMLPAAIVDVSVVRLLCVLFS